MTVVRKKAGHPGEGRDLFDVAGNARDSGLRRNDDPF